MRAKYKKNSSSGFYFSPNLRILGAIFDKKQNNSLHQLIFTPMFLKVKRSDYSEIFTWGNCMLEDSFKTRMLFNQALWTFAISFKTTLFCCILTPWKFTRNFLENALIDFVTILPSLRRLCQVPDAEVVFPKLSLVASYSVLCKMGHSVISLLW